MAGDEPLRVIQYHSSNTASATEDGIRFVCSDGSTWQFSEPFEKHRTGQRHGVLVGDTIIEK